jgi:hypothetical protein
MAIRAVPGGQQHRADEYDEQAPHLPAYLCATELLHVRACWPTIAMAILNLPALAPPAVDDLYPGLAPLSAMLGILGVVATVGLLRRVDWGTPLVLAAAALNALVGEVAVVTGLRAGLVGIGFGLLTLALATPVARRAPRF